MPTYEYECDACGHKFEKFHSITAAPIKKCPVCGKSKVNRLIGAGAGLIFKGSGFYITDYRDSSYKDKAKAEGSSAGTSSDASSNGKAETKAAGSDAAAGSSDASAKSNTAGASAAPAKSESKPAPR